jgi:transposase InsO family protein
MTSPTPGLVAQMTGRPTHLRYKHAAVYVDQATGHGFVWLQKSISSEETLKGKIAFERYCNSYGVSVMHYHADNGIFSANAWRSSCNELGQGLSFAGVNAHHQNGVAERRIRDLQEMARTMLIHAHRRWPSAITANLWPYAIRMANDAINATPNLKDKEGRTPLEVFANTQVASNPKHWHHFGCPVYVLDDALQSSAQIFHKWKERSRVGV